MENSWVIGFQNPLNIAFFFFLFKKAYLLSIEINNQVKSQNSPIIS